MKYFMIFVLILLLRRIPGSWAYMTSNKNEREMEIHESLDTWDELSAQEGDGLVRFSISLATLMMYFYSAILVVSVVYINIPLLVLLVALFIADALKDTKLVKEYILGKEHDREPIVKSYVSHYGVFISVAELVYTGVVAYSLFTGW